MSPLHLRKFGLQLNQPKDREGLSRTRRPGGGHLGHSGGWKDIEGSNTHSAIHITIQQKPQTRGLEGYRAKVQPSIPLGRTWSKFPEDISQRDRLQRPYSNYKRLEAHQAVQTPGGEGKQDKGESSHYPSYRRTADPDRSYSDSFKLTRSRPNQLSIGFTPFRNQQISGQESTFFTIPGSFQEKTRIQGQKQDLFQPKAERVRPNDAESVVLGERSTKEPEIVVHTSKISIPIDRNITPTHIENRVVAPQREYDHMNLIDYTVTLFIDGPSIPDYWITARLNTAFKEHASIWYTEMKEVHGRRNLAWWKSKIIQNKAMVVGYSRRPFNLRMTSTLWTNIHMSGVSDSLKYLKPLVLK
ncbi:hypothetical protein O181_023807 [Austropuccinia psidii MF-1]|uniref:Uncharacterized protein n=1 Tax=Austropuccinia psidii MF-1 TaxID=1389203 RepID=A0A9Q3GYC9_9BASI|nr:hypothetical protein [Austropuccinia psidii MF-1]